MTRKKQTAFTLLELVFTIVIIGTVSLITIPNLLATIKDFKLKENVLIVKQAVNEARTLAIKKSRTIIIDFSQANVNHESNGGLLQITYLDGTVVSKKYLDSNILYNAGKSSISNNKISFNFQGQPVISGSYTSFYVPNNKITISYYNKNGIPLASKSISISPYTGSIE